MLIDEKTNNNNGVFYNNNNCILFIFVYIWIATRDGQVHFWEMSIFTADSLLQQKNSKTKKQ